MHPLRRWGLPLPAVAALFRLSFVSNRTFGEINPSGSVKAAVSPSLVGAVKRVAGNVRLVVRNKGKRYLSDAINFRTQDMNYFRPLDVLGAEFDPVDKAPLPKIPESGFEVSESDFDNIQAVGLYVDALERNADNGPYFYLKESLVDAEVSK